MTKNSLKNVDKKTYKRIIKIINFILPIVIYFYLSRFLRDYNTDKKMTILGFELNNSIRNGIITQIQMLISVYLVLNTEKKGYIAALFLNAFGLIMAFSFSISTKSIDSIPGVISYSGVIIIINLIYSYKKKIKSKYRLLKQKEFELKQMAYFDSLTDVFNRKMFIEALDINTSENNNIKEFEEVFLIPHIEQSNKSIYVIFIDIDDFKNINDTYGHFAGDIVLVELVKRVKEILTDADIIGRLGGDELGIILRRKIKDDTIKDFIENIKKATLRPCIINGKEVKSTTSMGVAVYPDDSTESVELIKKADIAMYKAKEKGKNNVVYYNELDNL